MHVEELGLAEWGDALPDDGFEVFHLPAALEVLGEYATGDLVLLGAFKGQQPVGLLPVVVEERSLGTAVLSPPPGLGVPRLGPVVTPTSPKRRKRERVNRSFAEAVLDRLDVEASLTLFRVVCGVDYADPRPFVWADLDLDAAFTYRLDAGGTDAEALLAGFSKSLRREIRDGRAAGVTVERAGTDAARTVFEDTRARYEEQDRAFRLPWPYVRDLVEALGDRARVYVARSPDGEFRSGVTVLYSNDAAYFWQGGARATYDGTSVNSLLHWRVLEDLLADPPVESADRYDLMGANTERLCRYKSKFGADLVPYYVVESPGKGIDVAKAAYRMVSR